MRPTLVPSLTFAVCIFLSGVLRAQAPASDLAVSFQNGESLSTEDVAALMGGFIWKMEVTLPAGSKTISVCAERGGSSKKCNALTGTIGTDISDATVKPIVLVAVIPLDGSITSAVKLRISLVVRTKTGGGTTCASTAGEVDNPLRNATAYQMTTPPKEVVHGEFDLMEGQGNGAAVVGKASTPSAAIRLHISAN
jgi:hypothetical protein